MDVDPAPPAATAPSVRCPFSLTVEPIARMLNLELADHPVYDGLELQWFDDDVHGTGMLAFLSRRAGRAVDYYAQPGLRLDPAGYRIGGGTRSWNETEFAVARLEVADDGVDAHVGSPTSTAAPSRCASSTATAGSATGRRCSPR